MKMKMRMIWKMMMTWMMMRSRISMMINDSEMITMMMVHVVYPKLLEKNMETMMVVLDLV